MGGHGGGVSGCWRVVEVGMCRRLELGRQGMAGTWDGHLGLQWLHGESEAVGM